MPLQDFPQARRNGRWPMATSLLTLSLLCSGCVVPKSQVATLQSQNRTLAEQSKSQLAEIENLKIHARSVEDRLIRSEEEMARLEQQNGRDRQKLSNYRDERDQLRGGIPDGLNGRLIDLAQRYPSLQYDPKIGVSKLDTDLLFDSGDAELKPGAERILAEFADIFKSPDGREFKIMVIGHADAQGIKGREVRQRYPNNWHLSAGRALAVADRLRKAGLPEDRMGVAGFGQFQPVSANDSADARQKNRRVEIYVLGPETPVVGWADNNTRLR
jgi:chemotaxis protein MotB